MTEAGLRALLDLGWRETWLAPRMLRGPDVGWRPDMLWGQFNFGLG